MKVLDLQCAHQHTFEGWFASEDDYTSQQQRGMVSCPLCGDDRIEKKLSVGALDDFFFNSSFRDKAEHLH